MPKKYIIYAIIAILVLGLGYFVYHMKKPISINKNTMNSDTAYGYVNAWAQEEKEDIKGIQRNTSSGDFFGRVASLGFVFNSKTSTLSVFGTVQPSSQSLYKYTDIMDELNRISREEPSRVDNASFDLTVSPWDKTEPTLYLRLDYTQTDKSPDELILEWKKLRETAYLWLRNRYVDAIDPIVQKRLKDQSAK